jgi:hypothetical protein
VEWRIRQEDLVGSASKVRRQPDSGCLFFLDQF